MPKIGKNYRANVPWNTCERIAAIELRPMVFTRVIYLFIQIVGLSITIKVAITLTPNLSKVAQTKV